MTPRLTQSLAVHGLLRPNISAITSGIGGVMATARTVLGDVAAEKLGITLAHEHVVVSLPSAPYDYYGTYNRQAIVEEVCRNLEPAVRNHGLRTVVDAAPSELGRDVEVMQAVSKRTGVNIIASTGCYRHGGGFPFIWQGRDVDALAGHFVKEITEGIGPNKVKCGVIKLASTEDKIDAVEEKAFRAAARASKQTGCPIITHTDARGWATANVGKNQLDMLLSEGADPGRVMVGHVCGTSNLWHLWELVRQGCFVGFDQVGWAAARGTRDNVYASLIAALCAAGFSSQILLSMDHQSVYFPPRPPREGAPEMTFSTLQANFLPRLRAAGVKESFIEEMLVKNPARLFGGF